jgi:peptidyl-prolyl cis-trans isomerase C
VEEKEIIVAEVGDCVITSEELRKRLIGAYQGGHDESARRIEPVGAEAVLLKMLAEKAMVIQGREEGLLELDDAVTVKERNQDLLLGSLSQSYLEGKVNVTESEVDKKVKAAPKLNPAQARRMLERERSAKLMEQFLSQLREKLNVRKLRHNFPKGAEIYQRLRHRPKNPKKTWWITWTQVGMELTKQERELELATFDGGKVTWVDWFRVLHKFAPLKRPRDLATVQGFERLLDMALSRQVFLAEARLRGLDKNEDYRRKAREQEERHLLRKFSDKAFEGLTDPTKQEMRAYFDEHKEQFRRPDTIKIDVVWCQDLATAQKVKEELGMGKDFEPVREQYPLKKNEGPYDVTVGKEGVFFEDLWKAEPGEIIGPIKGFFPKRENRRLEWQIKWRIVKVVEKKPGELREYSSGVERDVRGTIRGQQREAIMDACREGLFEKYPYKIYTKKLKGIDPFDTQ